MNSPAKPGIFHICILIYLLCKEVVIYMDVYYVITKTNEKQLKEEIV